MAFLSDFDSQTVLARWEDWWVCANETPLITAWITTNQTVDTYSLGGRERWLDFEARIAAFSSQIAAIPEFGDNLPMFNPDLGPDIASTPWGTDLEFAAHTSWAHPLAESLSELELGQVNLEAELWQAVKRLINLSLEAGKGKWLTGYTDLHLGADLLVSLIGPENLCIQIAEDPHEVRDALQAIQPACLNLLASQQSRVLESQGVCFSWMGAPSANLVHIPSCDFCCLISENHFQEIVLPGIMEEAQASDRSIFHLDGPRALRHLESLLRIPSIHGIQWVYGAGGGPARNWISVYEKIQMAGKCMQVICEDAEDALLLAEKLRPEGVWFALPSLPLVEAEALKHEINLKMQNN
ncbi:MAG: hypothetical protein MUC92_06325 [Fimbriimonadaceae bacterium]|jgi:hypothetical protein|nr:hypothetical protein [Fimbriimonadaceae bacterium]